MWTAPCSQGDDIGLGDLIACAHMSGLLARSHMSAGQGGFRDVRPKHWRDHAQPLAPAGSLTSRVDRSHHLFVLLQGPASATLVHEYANPLMILRFTKLAESPKVLKILPSGRIRATQSHAFHGGRASGCGGAGRGSVMRPADD